jgi:uncharacterized protein with PIN domain
MKLSKLGLVNDQSSRKGHGQNEQFQRCELCNVPIFRNPCRDVRSSGVFKGKGEMLCNKCAETLSKIPAEQALQALNNASETYSKE